MSEQSVWSGWDERKSWFRSIISQILYETISNRTKVIDNFYEGENTIQVRFGILDRSKMFTEKNLPLLFQHLNVFNLHTRLTDLLCSVLFILGIIGNVLGLFIFSSSRRSWRISSMYAHLATLSSITNFLCLIRYASILHSSTRQILSDWIGRVWWACKTYELSFAFRLISSWITLLWMFERVICVSRRLKTLIKRWNTYKLISIIAILFITAVFAGVIVLPMYMFEPQILK